MSEPLLIRVRNALAGVQLPGAGKSIVAAGAVQGLEASADGKVRFVLEAPQEARAHIDALAAQAKAAAEAVGGVTQVSVIATVHGSTGAQPDAQAGARAGGHDNPMGLKRAPKPAGDALGAVKTIIAVASGKGGVGKSTVAANLAVAFARAGRKTGFLDGDIYGPSAPTLFGVTRKADVVDGDIQPISAHGVSVMSIGFLVDPQQALAWRGPMVMGALRQLMRDVAWGALDVLIIDTPPGTGDAHLSLVQSKRLTGAVIVSTPQEMALADVRRGVALFRKTNVPVLGVIENMAWLESADGARVHIFGEGGAQQAAAELDAPFLGALPLYPDLRAASDAGAPLAPGDHPAADDFARLAQRISDAVSQLGDR